MTTEKQTVLATHPEARAFFNADTGSFKVYDGTKACIALSRSWPTEFEAWSEAAETVQRKTGDRP